MSSEIEIKSDDDQSAINLIDHLTNFISKNDIEAIDDMQKTLLNRFEKSNQMLVNCNELSNQHFLKLSKDFRLHTIKLNEMYKDLDSIFHRIRMIKQKLREKYPDIKIDAYSKPVKDDDEEDEIPDSIQDLKITEKEPNKQDLEINEDETNQSKTISTELESSKH